MIRTPEGVATFISQPLSTNTSNTWKIISNTVHVKASVHTCKQCRQSHCCLTLGNMGFTTLQHVGALGQLPPDHSYHCIIELLFVFVEAVFVAPRSEELGIAAT